MTTYRNYVGGEWLAASDARPNVNPSDLGDCIGDYAESDAATVAQAAEAAAAARPRWAAATVQDRANVLDTIADELFRRKDEIGTLVSREEGKTLAEGTGEALRAAQIFRFYAGEAVRNAGEALGSLRAGLDIEVTREPLGVVGLVTPWNFQLGIPAWKIAPALAYGNCVVHKPAELTPGSAWVLAEIISRAGLPPGAFNLVMGAGARVGQALVDHPLVDGISFTGSVAVGEKIAASAVRRMARFQLEMGGKNPLVVLDDADLETALECALAAYTVTGQRCTASTRLLVTPGIHDRFVTALTERLRAIRVGHALDPATQMGPVVDENQLAKDLRYIEGAVREGARLVTGGTPVERPQRGHYLAPALFTETTPQMRINREEVFGPVTAVLRVRDYEEALAVANDTEFGLAAGICTASLQHARHFLRNAQAGMVMVNAPTGGADYHVPFGGRKRSSYGPREQGSYARDFHTIVKTGYLRA
jgi:aldehyde dehydrogenase (NAD+)